MEINNASVPIIRMEIAVQLFLCGFAGEATIYDLAAGLELHT